MTWQYTEYIMELQKVRTDLKFLTSSIALLNYQLDILKIRKDKTQITKSLFPKENQIMASNSKKNGFSDFRALNEIFKKKIKYLRNISANAIRR